MLKEKIEKINETTSWFFEKIKFINLYPDSSRKKREKAQSRKKREKAQINTIRNKKQL